MSKLDHLTNLTIGKATDKTLEDIASLRHLQQLTLQGEISANGVLALKSLKTLQAIAYNMGRVTDALPRPINFGYTDCSINDVVDYFHQLTDVPIRIDRETVAALQIPSSTVVSDAAKQTSLHDALDRLLLPHGLDFRIEKDEIVVTTREEADQARAGIRALQKNLPKLQTTGW